MDDKKDFKTREDFETEAEWWTYQLTNDLLDDEEEEEPKEEVDEYGIFECMNCGEIIDEEITKPDITKKYSERLRCPKCGKRKFKKIIKEKKEQLLRKKKNKEEQEKKDVATDYSKDMQNDIKDLFDDLEIKLKNKEITPERFVALFYSISCKIMTYYDKAYRKQYFASFIDWKSEPKRIYEMGQTILDLYDIKQTQEDITKSYEAEKDEVYNAYMSKYEHGDEEAFKEYKDNATLKGYIKQIAARQVAEEQAMKRLEKNEQKLSDKQRAKSEDDFRKSLESNVKRL